MAQVGVTWCCSPQYLSTISTKRSAALHHADLVRVGSEVCEYIAVMQILRVQECLLTSCGASLPSTKALVHAIPKDATPFTVVFSFANHGGILQWNTFSSSSRAVTLATPLLQSARPKPKGWSDVQPLTGGTWQWNAQLVSCQR